MNIDLSSSNSLSAHKLEQFLFIALAGYQLLIIFSVATDINGETKLVPKGVILILGLLASYSFVICFFAFGYDRYLLVNYFFWFGAIGLFLRAIAKKLQHKSARS